MQPQTASAASQSNKRFLDTFMMCFHCCRFGQGFFGHGRALARLRHLSTHRIPAAQSSGRCLFCGKSALALLRPRLAAAHARFLAKPPPKSNISRVQIPTAAATTSVVFRTLYATSLSAAAQPRRRSKQA